MLSSMVVDNHIADTVCAQRWSDTYGLSSTTSTTDHKHRSYMLRKGAHKIVSHTGFCIVGAWPELRIIIEFVGTTRCYCNFPDNPWHIKPPKGHGHAVAGCLHLYQGVTMGRVTDSLIGIDRRYDRNATRPAKTSISSVHVYYV